MYYEVLWCINVYLCTGSTHPHITVYGDLDLDCCRHRADREFESVIWLPVTTIDSVIEWQYFLRKETRATNEAECSHAKPCCETNYSTSCTFFPCYPTSIDCGVWNGRECRVWSVKTVECWVGNAVSRVWSGDCELWSVESVKCEVKSAKSGVQSVDCGVSSVEWRVWSGKCRVSVWSVKCKDRVSVWSVNKVQRVVCGVSSIQCGV